MAKLAFNSRSERTSNLTTLRQEHETLDSRLQKLDRQRSLSPEEQYEMMVIKKRKLALKDRINSMEG